MKKQTFCVYTYDELDELIKLYFGRDFEFVADHEANNYTAYTFHLRNDWFKLSDWKDVLRWATTGQGWDMTQDLLGLLAYAGAIPAGDYLVTVFW